MFHKICIKPNEQTFPTDIGLIAENLLYYQNVELIAGTDSFPILIKNLGVDILIELLKNRNLKIRLSENHLGVLNQVNQLGENITDVILVTSPDLTKEEMIFRALFMKTDRRGYSNRITQKLLPYVESINYQDDICDLVREDINNSYYLKQSIIDTIKFYNPSITLRQEEIEYSFTKAKTYGYIFKSNLNFDIINHKIPNNPDGKLITPSSLIMNILETRGDMHLASYLNSDISTTGVHTELMKIKFLDIYQKSQNNLKELFQFNDFILSNGHAIREVINTGERNYNDFLKVLDKADRFRDWLKDIEDDKSIIKEYYEAVTSETWINKLPSKAMRWSFFTGAGLLIDFLATGGISTLIGLGVSAGDAFFLDKIIKGWKPNVFIESNLKKFVKK